LATKAGIVVAGSFAGNPKKATVTFATSFADASYAVVLTCVTTNDKAFTPSVESQAAGSFVINMTVNSITNLTQVNWAATYNGEAG
jgi:hypothetical protein